jgi:RecB family exonuclease
MLGEGMAYSIPLDFYQQVEQDFGKELATKVAKAVEDGIALVEENARVTALQKKIELKEELTKELATKADIAELRGKIDALDMKFTGKIDALDMKFTGKIDALDMKFMGEMKAMEARTQGEFKAVREEMKAMETRLQSEIRATNQKLNFLIGLMILALTTMNPVVTELLKRWLKF